MPPAFRPNFSQETRFSPCLGPKIAQKRRTPRVSGPSGSEQQGKNPVFPREKGQKKRAKIQHKIKGA